MDQDAIWCGGGPQPTNIVLDGDPAPPSKKGTAALIFGPSIMAGWIDHDETWRRGRPRLW